MRSDHCCVEGNLQHQASSNLYSGMNGFHWLFFVVSLLQYCAHFVLDEHVIALLNGRRNEMVYCRSCVKDSEEDVEVLILFQLFPYLKQIVVADFCQKHALTVLGALAVRVSLWLNI